MKKKRLQVWALMAEIVSGIAVVATLIFLIIEVRNNSELVQASTFERNTQSMIDYRASNVANDRSLEEMTEYWEMDSPEQLRRSLLVLNLWGLYEKAYFSQQYGLFGSSEWQRYTTSICRNLHYNVEQWKSEVAPYLIDEFHQYVLDECGIR